MRKWKVKVNRQQETEKMWKRKKDKNIRSIYTFKIEENNGNRMFWDIRRSEKI